MASWVSLSDGNLSSFSETLGKNVLTKYSWNMSLVSWNMLKAEFVAGSRNPSDCFLAWGSINVFRRFIFTDVSSSSWRCRVETYAMGSWSTLGVNCSPWSLMPAIINDQLVDLPSCHGKEIILGWYETSVTRKIGSSEYKAQFWVAIAHFILFEDAS